MGFVYIDDAPKVMKLLNDIFTSEFMTRHTKFQSFEGFRYSSAVIVNWDAGRIVYNDALLDRFVQESTEFPSWDAMVRTATQARYHSQQKGCVQV